MKKLKIQDLSPQLVESYQRLAREQNGMPPLEMALETLNSPVLDRAIQRLWNSFMERVVVPEMDQFFTRRFEAGNRSLEITQAAADDLVERCETRLEWMVLGALMLATQGASSNYHEVLQELKQRLMTDIEALPEEEP